MSIDRVHCAHGGQRVTLDEVIESAPGHRAKTVPAVKPLVPAAQDFVEKTGQRSRVARDTVVRLMPTKLLVELRLLLPKRPMPVRLAPHISAPH